MMYSEREPFTVVENDFTNTQTADGNTSVDNSTTPCADGYENLPKDTTTAIGETVVSDGTESATSDNDAVADAAADTELPDSPDGAIEGFADNGDVSKYGSMYNKLPEGMHFENGILFEGEKPRPSDRRVIGQVRVSEDLRDRIKVVADLERRKMTAVVEEAIRMFLAKSINEPRPYLPITTEPQTTRIAWYTSVEMDSMIRARAMSEGRDVMTVVRRALLDYVEASPYDPLHLMAPKAPAEIPGAEPSADAEFREEAVE